MVGRKRIDSSSLSNFISTYFSGNSSIILAAEYRRIVFQGSIVYCPVQLALVEMNNIYNAFHDTIFQLSLSLLDVSLSFWGSAPPQGRKLLLLL